MIYSLSFEKSVSGSCSSSLSVNSGSFKLRNRGDERANKSLECLRKVPMYSGQLRSISFSRFSKSRSIVAVQILNRFSLAKAEVIFSMRPKFTSGKVLIEESLFLRAAIVVLFEFWKWWRSVLTSGGMTYENPQTQIPSIMPKCSMPSGRVWKQRIQTSALCAYLWAGDPVVTPFWGLCSLKNNVHSCPKSFARFFHLLCGFLSEHRYSIDGECIVKNIL